MDENLDAILKHVGRTTAKAVKNAAVTELRQSVTMDRLLDDIQDRRKAKKSGSGTVPASADPSGKASFRSKIIPFEKAAGTRTISSREQKKAAAARKKEKKQINQAMGLAGFVFSCLVGALYLILWNKDSASGTKKNAQKTPPKGFSEN